MNRAKHFAIAGITLGIAAAAAAQDIKVTVDDNEVNFGGGSPIMQAGRVLVPMRAIFERLGAYVQWNPVTRSIDAQRGTTQVRMVIGLNTATINGTETTLEVPAQIVQGSTMVPLRFVSEAMGANVNWQAANRLVAISSNGLGDVSYGPGPDTTNTVQVVSQWTVIPVALSNNIASNTAKKGDRFSAKVASNNEAYGAIPQGSIIQGYVRDARAQSGTNPGVLELGFDQLKLPDGQIFPIDGTLYSLDSKAVDRQEDGTLKAKDRSANNRIAYAGYGAGAGLLVGLLDNGRVNLTTTLLGALAGFAIGSIEKPKQKPTNVNLNAGTEFGVRLNKDLALKTGA